jgi:hypothetical protein
MTNQLTARSPWRDADHLTPKECSLLPYVAYGSNLSMEGMTQRCRDAIPIETVGTCTVPGYLLFRGVADVIESVQRRCPVGLWRVSEEDVRHLDAYEAWPSLYRRVIVPVRIGYDQVIQGFMYAMNSDTRRPPNPHYYSIIRRGYSDFGIKPAPLYKALEWSLRQVAQDEEEYRNMLFRFLGKVVEHKEQPIQRRIITLPPRQKKRSA